MFAISEQIRRGWSDPTRFVHLHSCNPKGHRDPDIKLDDMRKVAASTLSDVYGQVLACSCRQLKRACYEQASRWQHQISWLRIHPLKLGGAICHYGTMHTGDNTCASTLMCICTTFSSMETNLCKNGIRILSDELDRTSNMQKVACSCI